MKSPIQSFLPLEGLDNDLPTLKAVEKEIVRCLAILLLQVLTVERGKEDEHDFS